MRRDDACASSGIPTKMPRIQYSCTGLSAACRIMWHQAGLLDKNINFGCNFSLPVHWASVQCLRSCGAPQADWDRRTTAAKLRHLRSQRSLPASCGLQSAGGAQHGALDVVKPVGASGSDMGGCPSQQDDC